MATELLKRGILPPWEVSGLLGHKPAGYARFDPDYLGKSAKRIDAYFTEL